MGKYLKVVGSDDNPKVIATNWSRRHQLWEAVPPRTIVFFIRAPGTKALRGALTLMERLMIYNILIYLKL